MSDATERLIGRMVEQHEMLNGSKPSGKALRQIEAKAAEVARGVEAKQQHYRYKGR